MHCCKALKSPRRGEALRSFLLVPLTIVIILLSPNVPRMPSAVAAVVPCPAPGDATTGTLTSDATYQFLGCGTSAKSYAFHYTAEPNGSPYPYALRNIAVIIDGGSWLPVISIAQTLPLGLRLLANISITYRNINVPPTAFLSGGAYLQLFLDSFNTTANNVRVDMSSCTLPTRLAGHLFDMNHNTSRDLSVTVRDCLMPWEINSTIVSVNGGTVAGLVIHVSNVTTNAAATPSDPARRMYNGLGLVIVQSSNLTNATIVLAGFQLGDIEGNGNVLFLFAVLVSTRVTITDMVLPKNASRRSFIIQSVGVMRGLHVVVNNIRDAPVGYIATQASTRGYYENTTTFIWASVVDSTFVFNGVMFLRPSLRCTSWFAFRGGTLSNTTFSFTNFVMTDAILAPVPVVTPAINLEHVGNCNGAMLCLNTQYPVDVRVTWDSVQLQDVIAAVPLVQWRGDMNYGMTFKRTVAADLSRWVITDSSFSAGWVQLYTSEDSPYVNKVPISGDPVAIALTHIAFPAAGSSSTVAFPAPAVYAGWTPSATQQMYQTQFSAASTLTGIQVVCTNVTGHITGNSSFIAFFADTQVAKVSVTFQQCELDVTSTPCFMCFTLGGRASHLAIGRVVLKSIALNIISSRLTGETSYQGKGYVMSLASFTGPADAIVPTVTWSDINTTIVNSYVYADGPASSALNWWYVLTVFGSYVYINNVTLVQWARTGKFGYLDSTPRCSLLQLQAATSGGSIVMQNSTAVFYVYGGQPTSQLRIAIADSAAGNLLVIGALVNAQVIVSDVHLRCVVENGTLTPVSIDPYTDFAASNQVSVSIVILDPRAVSYNSSVVVSRSVVDSYINVQIVNTAIQGVLASCSSVTVAGNCTGCVFMVDNCTIINNSTLSAPQAISKPRLVAPVFFQPLAKLLTTSLPSTVLAVIPNLASFSSTQHVNCTIVVTNTFMYDNSPPTSIVLAVFVLPADNSDNYVITVRNCAVVPSMRGSLQPYDYPIYVGGACFAGCTLRHATIVVDGLTGLVPSVWALTGGAMIMSGASSLRVVNSIATCAYTIPSTIRSAFPHETNCSIVRFVSRGISKGQPGSLHLSDTSFIEVSRNRFVDDGYSSAVLRSDDNGVVSRGTAAFTSVDATWRMGCNVVGPRRAPLPGRLTPLEYFAGMDAAQLVFPPDAGLPGSYAGVVCRAPSGGETATATRYEPPGPWTRPVVQAVIASTTPQTWALVAAGVLGPASSASGASMSRVQGAFVVLALRDRCRSYELSVSEGGEPAPDDTVVFGTNSVDNPLGIDMSGVVEGGAGVTVGTLVGNTLLVVICAAVALLTTTVIKPPLLRYVKALEAQVKPARREGPPGITKRRHASKYACWRWCSVNCNVEWLRYHAVKWLYAGVHTLPSDPFPASIYTSYTLLLQPSVTAALLLVAFSNSGGGQAGSAVGVIFGLLWLSPALWFTYVVALRVRPLPLRTQPAVLQSRKKSCWHLVAAWIFEPEEVWMPPKAKSHPADGKRVQLLRMLNVYRTEYARLLFDRYMCVFDVYRQRRFYFFAIEIAGAVFLGVVGAAALGVPPESACDAAVWGSWLVIGCSCALLLAVAALRPHTVRFDLIVLVSGTVLCLGSEVASMTEDDEAGGVLLIVTAWTQILFLVLNLAAEWMEGDGDHRRRLIEMVPVTKIGDHLRDERHHRHVPQLHAGSIPMEDQPDVHLTRNRQDHVLELLVQEVCRQQLEERRRHVL